MDRSIPTILLSCLLFAITVTTTVAQKSKNKYQPPRPPIGGLHLGMSTDSVDIIFRKLALRKTTLRLDSLTLIESDSVRIFGEAAYVRVDILHGKARTIVVNYHPLAGDRYLNTRDMVASYLERYFGRGIITKDQSVVYRRWETEDGTMEASFTDKYLRVFLRLGKR